MQIIKDRQIVDDQWSYAPDGSPLKTGDITVSLKRWQSEKDQLLSHEGNLGIRLTTNDLVEEIQDDLCHFKLIELDFPAFTDGRCFSQAVLLRKRFGFDGEIRATGNFIRDQLFYLSRAGVNSFNLGENEDLKEAATALNDFTVKYQKSVC